MVVRLRRSLKVADSLLETACRDARKRQQVATLVLSVWALVQTIRAKGRIVRRTLVRTIRPGLLTEPVWWRHVEVRLLCDRGGC